MMCAIAANARRPGGAMRFGGSTAAALRGAMARRMDDSEPLTFRMRSEKPAARHQKRLGDGRP